MAHLIRLKTSLPSKMPEDAQPLADQLQTHRPRYSMYEYIDTLAATAQLLANGEPLYAKPPPGQHNLSYEQLAKHAIHTHALRDISCVRTIGTEKTTVPLHTLQVKPY